MPTASKNTRTALVCLGTGCVSSGAVPIYEALKKAIADEKLNIETKLTGCHGFCQRGPIVVVEPDGVF